MQDIMHKQAFVWHVLHVGYFGVGVSLKSEVIYHHMRTFTATMRHTQASTCVTLSDCLRALGRACLCTGKHLSSLSGMLGTADGFGDN